MSKKNRVRDRLKLSKGPSDLDNTGGEDLWVDINEHKSPLSPQESPGISELELGEEPRPPSPTTSVPSSLQSQSTSRKRRGTKTVYVAVSPRKSYPISRVERPPVKPASRATLQSKTVVSTDAVTDTVVEGVKYTFGYAFDVVFSAIRLLRKPLSILLFLWLLALIIGTISSTLRAAFAPLCYLPGLSSSAMCLPDPAYVRGGKHPPQWADYPKLVDVQSATFEQLLDESVGGSGLSLEIKKAEMATSDLATLVRVSELKSRDILAESLVKFVDDAKTTGRGLQKLSSKVGGAVDSILAVNDYALHSIEEANANTPSLYSISALLPWSKTPRISDVVTQTFTESMNVVAVNMERLILEAEVNLANLDKLEADLSVLYEIVSREDSSLSSAKSELLSELWTKVGGNRKKLRGYDDHLRLLQNLGGYRKQALVHVVAALQTLRAMSDDMEDLRERVATPELAGSKIPVEVHMRSIRSGVERLKEGRIKAKKIEEEAVRRVLAVGSE